MIKSFFVILILSAQCAVYGASASVSLIPCPDVDSIENYWTTSDGSEIFQGGDSIFIKRSGSEEFEPLLASRDVVETATIERVSAALFDDDSGTIFAVTSIAKDAGGEKIPYLPRLSPELDVINWYDECILVAIDYKQKSRRAIVHLPEDRSFSSLGLCDGDSLICEGHEILGEGQCGGIMEADAYELWFIDTETGHLRPHDPIVHIKPDENRRFFSAPFRFRKRGNQFLFTQSDEKSNGITTTDVIAVDQTRPSVKEILFHSVNAIRDAFISDDGSLLTAVVSDYPRTDICVQHNLTDGSAIDSFMPIQLPDDLVVWKILKWEGNHLVCIVGYENQERRFEIDGKKYKNLRGAVANIYINEAE